MFLEDLTEDVGDLLRPIFKMPSPLPTIIDDITEVGQFITKIMTILTDLSQAVYRQLLTTLVINEGLCSLRKAQMEFRYFM